MIPIRNIYYMLSYAYEALRWGDFRKLGDEEFDNIDDLYSDILVRGMRYQLKRGVQREYIDVTENIATIRGKIDVSETLKTQALLRRRAVCNFDEFSVNSQMNRVIKTAMMILYRRAGRARAHDVEDSTQREARRSRREGLRDVLGLLTEVDLVDYHRINWRFHYDRNNAFYRLLMGVSRMVIEGRLQEERSGRRLMNDYLTPEDMKMSSLYESFLLNFYRRHYPELKPAAIHVDWDADDGFTELLPTMRTDITLTGEERTLVIDAKFYESGILKHNTKFENAAAKVNSGHMYQIYTYVKNLDRRRSGDIAGMLLYAQTDEEALPNHHYRISGNDFYVKTLDLNRRFEEIATELRGYTEMVKS